MKPRWRAYADWILLELKAAGMLDRAVLVLIGSVARGVQTRRSDVDLLLVLANEGRLGVRSPVDLHLQQESRARFLARLRARDDYPAWALRHGRTIYDPDGWWAAQAESEKTSGRLPDWTPKVDMARKSLRWAADLLATGDMEAFEEQCLYAASHLARAALLRRSVMPLSRPELAAQLREVGELEMATSLDDLARGGVGRSRAVALCAAMESSLDRMSATAAARRRRAPTRG